MYNNCTSECLGYISTCNWPKQLTTQRKSYKVNKKNRTKSYKTVHVHSWFRPSCCSTQQGEFVLSLQEINPWQSNPSLFSLMPGRILCVRNFYRHGGRKQRTSDWRSRAQHWCPLSWWWPGGDGWYHGGSPSLPIGTAGTRRSPCPFVWLYQPIYVGKYVQDCGRTATTMGAKQAWGKHFKNT